MSTMESAPEPNITKLCIGGYMDVKPIFFESVIAALDDHITVLDSKGEIVYVNDAWVRFAKNNHSKTAADWLGQNYLKACQCAVDSGDEYATKASEGLERIISGELDTFYYEYPCHAPDEERYFMMRLSRFSYENEHFILVVHKNITERITAEKKVLALSRMDGLTKIPNRRYFESFYKEEWNRCAREGLPISVAILDLDYFKSINDHYGHLYGDECLIQVADCIKQNLNRPRDLCARYGGEEFAVIMGNTPSANAVQLIERIRLEILSQKIKHKLSPITGYVTASIGVATITPSKQDDMADLLLHADKALYQAKSEGKNRTCCWPDSDAISLSANA